MRECEISISSCGCGSFLLDVRPVGSTGNKPILNFKTWELLIEYFEGMQVSEALLQQIDAVGEDLKKGIASHQRMFLPDAIRAPAQ